jgi:hypothetical protein
VDLKTRLLKKSEEERDAIFNEMHRLYANQLLNTILELRGFYIKIGQVMATRADILPPLWIEKLRTLEDEGCSDFLWRFRPKNAPTEQITTFPVVLACATSLHRGCPPSSRLFQPEFGLLQCRQSRSRRSDRLLRHPTASH